MIIKTLGFSTLVYKIANALLRNGFYIIWSLIIPLITIKMGQGLEMLEHYLDNSMWYEAPFLIFIFTTLGYSLWIIPTGSILLFKKILKLPVKKYKIFNDIIEYYNDNNQSLPIRYFSILPLIIFIISIGLSSLEYSNELHILYYAIIISVLLSFICLYWFFPRLFIPISLWFRKRITKAYFWDFLFVKYYYFIHKNDKQNLQNYLPLMRFNFWNTVCYCIWTCIFIGLWLCRSYLGLNTDVFRSLLMILLAAFTTWHYIILYYIENALFYYSEKNIKLFFNRYSKNEEVAKLVIVNPDLSFRMTDFNYKVLLASILGCVSLLFIFSQMNHIGFFSPLFVLLSLFCFFLLSFDFFFKLPLNLIRIYENRTDKKVLFRRLQLGLIFLGFVFWGGLLLYDSNAHRIRVNTMNNLSDVYLPNERLDIKSYFEQWQKDRNIQGKDTIFLIAGQGGGSRAAAWSHMNLNYLDDSFKLIKNVFAFSTASGSSVGINMKLAEWRVNQLLQKNNCAPYNGEELKTLYTTNYFSNSFYGMLLGDLIENIGSKSKSLFGSKDDFDKDRNYRLQKEELRGCANTFLQNISGTKKTEAMQLLKKHFEDDYLSFYYPKDNFIKKHFSKKPPLFFINTTQIQRGQRCVFSPVKLNSFFYAWDVYDSIKTRNCSNKHSQLVKNIPLVTAVCQSQGVPLLNSMNYVKNFGNLADGGIAENSGCANIYNLYQSLRSFLSPDSVTIVVVFIQNSALDNTEKNVPKTASALSGALSAVFNTGITAYSSYWRHILEDEVKNYNVKNNASDVFFKIALKDKITLARILNNRTIETIQKNITENTNQLNLIKKYIKKN